VELSATLDSHAIALPPRQVAKHEHRADDGAGGAGGGSDGGKKGGTGGAGREGDAERRETTAITPNVRMERRAVGPEPRPRLLSKTKPLDFRTRLKGVRNPFGGEREREREREETEKRR